jgi:hypothetical protein
MYNIKGLNNLKLLEVKFYLKFLKIMERMFYLQNLDLLECRDQMETKMYLEKMQGPNQMEMMKKKTKLYLESLDQKEMMKKRKT